MKTASTAKAAGTARLGIGIDAGGTYTDVVLFDFARQEVLQKAKRLTTKWDYALAIDAALEALDSSRFARVDLICVSTTLATNAVVEGRGQRVGLLLMPPYGLRESGVFHHDRIAYLDGRLEIDGRELQGVDPLQVQATARRLLEEDGVQAFAVAGFASHVNPLHELQVKEALRAVTPVAVVCGHELSDRLNYRVRAETAVLNAQIIPCLESFLAHVELAVRRRGLCAPLMVVRSDGTLMSLEAARQRPVQTILSGPAASVAGASYLTRVPDALIVDIGGTTTDTAVVRQGHVQTSRLGARVGRWQTHVEALEMRTLGLGGDSRMVCRAGELVIGPQRVTPLAWLSSVQPRLGGALDWIEQHAHRFRNETRGMELLALTPYAHRAPRAGLEQAIVACLSERPYAVDELVQVVRGRTEDLMPLDALEADHLVLRAGLTPTDLLHAGGRLALWDAEVARRACAIYARVMDLEMEAFVTHGIARFVRLLAEELIKTQLASDVDPEALAGSDPAMRLVGKALGDRTDGYALQIAVRSPLIGIGAPAHVFLPQAAALLHTHAIIPPHADVANAVGAITAQVCIRRRVVIGIDDAGVFRVEGLPGAPTFTDLAEAQAYATRELETRVNALACEAGGETGTVSISMHTRQLATRRDQAAFLDCTIEAVHSGHPDLARLRPQPIAAG